MTRTSLSLALMALLAACGDGQPFDDDEIVEEVPVPVEEVIPDEIEEPEDVLNVTTIAQPLTNEQEDRGDIIRAEAPNDTGGGTTSLFSFNVDDNTFEIDGLAFDGLNVYQVFAPLENDLGTVAIYAADAEVEDFLTGNPVGQIIPYFALYDASTVTLEDGTPRTSFSIVRTGGYADFGFGVFGYDRAGDAVIPTVGQATFSGDYAGTRVNGQLAILEVTAGDLTIDIDFDDFNGTPGIKGILENRIAFDSEGNPLVVNNSVLESDGAAGSLQLPNLTFDIRNEGTTISSTGEIGGSVSSTVINDQGQIEVYESGNYVGIIAGDLTDPNDGGEIVGVLVFDSNDNRFDNVIVQETGGFIATR